jgi:hypothetical protein
LSDSSRQLLVEAKHRNERSRELYATIRTSVKEKRQEGLLEPVDEYLALKPGDDRLLRLRDQLTRRQSRRRLKELATQIHQQVADKQHDGLLVLVEEFLESGPDDERMQRLADTLRTREEQARREVIADIKRRKWLLRFGVGSGAAALLLIVIGLLWNASRRAAEQTAVEQQAAARYAAQKAAALLAAIPAISVDEGQMLSIRVRVTDEVQFANDVVYNVVYKLSGDIPPGCTMDARSGALEWTPGEADGGSERQITVGAKFTGLPELNNERTFTVTVREVNSPPVVAPIPTQEVESGKPLRLRVVASDSDLPANQLRYQLDGPLPTGSSLDADTGEFVWTPDETVQLGLREFSLRVRDDGAPAREATVKIRVNVFKLTLKATLAQTLKGHSGPVTSVSFSPDGKRIVSGSYITLKVWDAATGQETLTLKGRSGSVHSVSFSPDGKRIVSGSHKTLNIWNAQTGKKMLTRLNLDPGVSVSFSPDGKRIASAGYWLICIWNVQTGQIVTLWNAQTGQIVPPDMAKFLMAKFLKRVLRVV